LLRISIKNKNERNGDIEYGFFTTTLDLIISNHSLDFPLFSNKGKQVGSVKFLQSKIIEQHSFMDYLQSGWSINMAVAIDYSASNGDPKDPSSLHHFDPKHPERHNPYEEAMMQVGKVLETYACGKRFMAYGLGAIPEYLGDKEVRQCFPLNGNNEDPWIHGLQELLKKYRESLKGVKLWGPTLFEEVFQKVFQSIEKKKSLDLYTVLLVLTDGCIHDMRQTIDVIVKASSHPISIVIVGIGDSDFLNMNILDADDGAKLVDSDGN
jgi:hypothetical protein